jgi:hypothetical protein
MLYSPRRGPHATDAHLTRRALGRSGALAQGGLNQVQRRRALERLLQAHNFEPYACLRWSRRNGAAKTQRYHCRLHDLLVDFTNVWASAPGGGDAGDSLFSLARTLADTKTLVCGKNCRSFRAENLYKRKNYPAEQRAALVPKQYLSKARSLDHQLHGTAWGTVGPIEAKLLTPLTKLTHTPS